MVLLDSLSRLSGADWSEVTDGQTGILQRETEADEVMRELMTLVRTNWPLQAYWGVQGDIFIVDGLLMAGSRIIIPEASRAQVLREIHEGHQTRYIQVHALHQECCLLARDV